MFIDLECNYEREMEHEIITKLKPISTQRQWQLSVLQIGKGILDADLLMVLFRWVLRNSMWCILLNEKFWVLSRILEWKKSLAEGGSEILQEEEMTKTMVALTHCSIYCGEIRNGKNAQYLP
jgi:hypothetical protein